jgi:hypothetical protein
MFQKYKLQISILGGLLVACLLIMTFIWYSFTQKYVQDSATTATKGILFKKTLKLEAYKNVSSGNDFWGAYDRYSRSDRHTEALTVYCKDFCKEK